ncbi:MAG TPA: RNA polymerase subunit sigma-70 [Planctomycetaceae bacterium]|mgnify:CR=1 FL=1|nr:RNA polymerase subunit sigma-70 [Planctomycetaceae bacterium]
MSAESTDSIELWQRIRDGDPDAIDALWDRFFPDLAALASRELRRADCASADGEDVALSALDGFLRADDPKYRAELTGPDSLWRLLSRMTRRKVIDRLRRERRQKRGRGQVRGNSGVGESGFDGLVGRGPQPALIAMVRERIDDLFARLADDELRELVVAKLEGHTNDEIAFRMGCSLSTVERRLRLVRRLWSEPENTLPGAGD